MQSCIESIRNYLTDHLKELGVEFEPGKLWYDTYKYNGIIVMTFIHDIDVIERSRAKIYYNYRLIPQEDCLGGPKALQKSLQFRYEYTMKKGVPIDFDTRIVHFDEIVTVDKFMTDEWYDTLNMIIDFIKYTVIPELKKIEVDCIKYKIESIGKDEFDE